MLLYSQNPADAVPGGADPKPLVTQGSDGNPSMLVFTSRERAASIAKQLPVPNAAPLHMPFRDVLKWAQVELGLWVNFGNALAVEATSAHLDDLRRKAGVFRP